MYVFIYTANNFFSLSSIASFSTWIKGSGLIKKPTSTFTGFFAVSCEFYIGKLFIYVKRSEKMDLQSKKSTCRRCVIL